MKTSAAVEATIVDATAEMFDCARVSLARMQGRSFRLRAVSHVEKLDLRGLACRKLVKQIESLEFPGKSNFVANGTEPNSTAKVVADSDVDALLFCFAATRSDDDHFRLFLQSSESKELDAVQWQALEQWSRQAFALLSDRSRFESIPLAKAYLAFAPAALTVAPSRYRRVLAMVGGALVAIMIAMLHSRWPSQYQQRCVPMTRGHITRPPMPSLNPLKSSMANRSKGRTPDHAERLGVG